MEFKACQGMIPSTVHITRSYIVAGETTYHDYPVVVVQRTDTIEVHGEGAQQQHPLLLDGKGTGNAVYYVSLKDGRIARLNAEQDLDLAFTISNRIHRFKQILKQEFNSVR